MNRREFCFLTAGGLLGARGAYAFAARRHRVLIVGAGMAGLAAGRLLADAGHDVVLIEARDRIGGRTWTSSRWADAPLDLGASWIHGVNGNPITRLANAVGARVKATRSRRSVLYDVHGDLLDSAQRQRLRKLTRAATGAVRRGRRSHTDRSLRDTVADGVDWPSLGQDDRRMVDFLLNNYEQEHAGSARRLSTRWIDEGKAFGGKEVVFVDGYRVIVDHLARGLAVERGQRVTAIEASPSGVSVTTQRGRFDGDRVIVTLPLGVLKRRSVRFSPALPASMRQAIDSLRMGVLNKCCLRFPRSFWPTGLDWLQFLPDRHGRWVEWLSMARPSGQPILIAFNAADFGRRMEAWSDEDVVADGMANLRNAFGNAIPDPVDHQITRWSSDPYASGSYSFVPAGAHPRLRDDLAGDVEGRIFFAGEATSRDYYATVHGAYLSGLRAARRVMAA